jgi:hypothetical protein
MRDSPLSLNTSRIAKFFGLNEIYTPYTLSVFPGGNNPASAAFLFLCAAMRETIAVPADNIAFLGPLVAAVPMDEPAVTTEERMLTRCWSFWDVSGGTPVSSHTASMADAVSVEAR